MLTHLQMIIDDVIVKALEVTVGAGVGSPGTQRAGVVWKSRASHHLLAELAGHLDKETTSSEGVWCGVGVEVIGELAQLVHPLTPSLSVCAVDPVPGENPSQVLVGKEAGVVGCTQRAATAAFSEGLPEANGAQDFAAAVNL